MENLIDLQTFVSTTLQQVIRAVRDAQGSIKEHGDELPRIMFPERKDPYEEDKLAKLSLMLQ